ncbi:PepSY domain-containing protein [Chitinimonas sp. BJB300]|uniref:PepSY domain-containing protein n=1 Tax=Chitinimonas sp. BJB300 TaxID=1559339 RepID=UPI000C0C7A35|nr:PepSY domain-containing protein [Chitinimonas sp. BJB300]PHV10427.1 N-acetylglucosamine transferase [Chitinimonas sp. BJB300]TSJ83304.1 N-acetylglucosamine transferase [Chitinimonas sp. BJB300]
MTRILHRWPGLVLAVLLLVMSLSGVALSIFPALDSTHAPQTEAGLTVAELAMRVQATHPGLEQIKRAPSGQLSAWWFDGEQPGSAVVDPATGRDVASADPDPVRRWLTSLHRSLFLGDGGRLTTAVGAIAMLILAISGAILVTRRTGGGRRWFARLRGPLPGRLHTEIARVVVLGLILSSTTAIWMSAETFEIVSIEPVRFQTPSQVSGLTGLALAEMDALRTTPVTELRELSFPSPSDSQDVFTLKTNRGTGYVDPGTGTWLSWQDFSRWQHLSETIYMLHTGQGAAVLGLMLGLMALGVPAMTVTGVLIWLAGRRGRPRLKGNSTAGQAETVVLLGSEGGSTWGFAAALASALRNAGQLVHVAPMTDFAPSRYHNVQRFLILAATYGEGDAPASASGFLEKLQGLSEAPKAPLAVLGFGDRSFPAFCAFAKAVESGARAKNWPALVPFHTIDRQSSQDFTRWGRTLGLALGIKLEIEHQPAPPVTEMLTLVERRDYGAAVQVPMAILRFALPNASHWQRLTKQGFVRFEAGDLLGILPEGSAVPRLYSLASGSRDSFIEIVVRKHPGGLSSGQLTMLEPGQKVRAFLRRNPGFHAGRDRTPQILIGAGTGVAPLAGFIRANENHRPMHLFFGLRNTDSDYLYREELSDWQTKGRLHHLRIAVSRGNRPQFVQDVLRQEASQVTDAILQGARVMVCGSREMAQGVADTLTDILKPLGLTPTMLKERERYVEDVY